MRQPNNAVLTDEHLNFWGNFFVENRLHERGVRFETFLQEPREIALAMIFRPRVPALEEFRPLLAAQRRAIAKPGSRFRAISRELHENMCIGCGCTDSHGCLTTGGVCHWLRVDSVRKIGVCSECPELVEAYDQARAGGELPDKTAGQIMAAARAQMP
ncbi:MAG: hypothetical protein AB1560_01960 [Pseudomonadota bacterium]